MSTEVQNTTFSQHDAKLPVSRPLPGSDEDLAAEIIARYWQNNGRQGRITKMMKEAFVDGAIWMKGRLSGNGG